MGFCLRYEMESVDSERFPLWAGVCGSGMIGLCFVVVVAAAMLVMVAIAMK